MSKIKCAPFLGILFTLFATACKPDKPNQERESPLVVMPPEQEKQVADTLIPLQEQEVVAPAPLAEKETPKSPAPSRQVPAERPQEKATTGQPATPAAPQPATGLQQSVYQLQQVQGENLPLLLDMTTDCDIKLISGTLSLRNGRFLFRSQSAEECQGERRTAETQEAGGSYRLQGNRILLNVETGEILGDATGIVEGNTIRLQQISNEEEVQEVDWVFRLK